MDPITVAFASALGKLGEQAIRDAYEALKAAIARKCGMDSKILRSVQDLEEDSASEASKLMIKEQVAKTGADKDADIVKAAQALQTLIDKSSTSQATSTVIRQQAGDNSMQFGQVYGNLDIQ